jgi:hypothetical protein
MRVPFRPLVVVGIFPLTPMVVRACSACIIADPKTAGTYLGMTMMMSILPLGLIGGLVYWFWRRYSDRPIAGPKKVASPSVEFSSRSL